MKKETQRLKNAKIADPKDSKVENSQYDNPSCPQCSSLKVHKKGKTNSTQRFICNECGKNWSVAFNNLRVSSNSKPATTQRQSESITNELFQRQIPLDEILSYLKDRLRNNQPIEFYYKDKSQTSRYEKFTMQGDTYINCYSNRYGNKVYKYRIDRIRNVKIL